VEFVFEDESPEGGCRWVGLPWRGITQAAISQPRSCLRTCSGSGGKERHERWATTDFC
jgi:hypothetical protein